MERVSEPLHQSTGRVGFGVVLGRVVTPAGRADRVWSIFPERAVEQGVEEDARGGQMDGGEAMPCGSVDR